MKGMGNKRGDLSMSEAKTLKLNKFSSIIWIASLIIIELLLVFNMIFKVSKDTVIYYIVSIILVFLMFIPGIYYNHTLIKNKNQISFFKFIIQMLFLMATFVALLEASFDSALTVKQVNKLLQFFEKNPTEPEKIEIAINQEKDTYEIGDLIKFEIDFTPNSADGSAVNFSTTNEIVTVDLYNKTIECLKNGTTTITFYCIDKPEVTDEITITIDSIVIEQITLQDEKSIFLEVDDIYQLKAPLILPEEAKDLEYQYSSSDDSVAVVDKKGQIKALSDGIAKIKCYTDDVYDEVYVIVDGLTEMNIAKDEINVVKGDYIYNRIEIDTNELKYIDKKAFSFELNSKLKAKFTFINIISNHIIISVNHYNDISKIEQVELTIKYTYPSGHVVSDTILLNLFPHPSLEVDDILNKTDTINQTIYYHNDSLITKYLYHKFDYTTIANFDVEHYKYEASDDLDLSLSTFQELIINLENSNLTKEKYTIKYYPSISDNYLEITVFFKKEYVDNIETNIDFELDNLYTEEEGINEIWVEYFTPALFNSITFNNQAYNNSGISIEVCDESKELVEIETNKYGLVQKLTLLGYKTNKPYSEILKFKVTSKLNEDISKIYTINVTNVYSNVTVNINNVKYTPGVYDITIDINDVLKNSVNSEFSYQYKGQFQKKFNTKFSTTSYKISNSNVLKYNTTNHSFIPIMVGECQVVIILYNYKNLEQNYEIVLNIKVEGEGEEHIDPNFYLEVNSHDDYATPDLINNYFSVGDMFNIIMSEHTGFVFSTNQPDIIELSNNSVKCIASGTATILITHPNYPSYIDSVVINVFDTVGPIVINKGEFKTISFNDKGYTLEAKVNKLYQLNITLPENKTSENIRLVFESDKVLIEGKNITISSVGKFTGKVIYGDETSPYTYEVQVTIVCNEKTFSQSFIYFIRKSVGHFGLFFIISALGFLSLFILDCFKINNKKILCAAICLFGLVLAVTTELIQKLTPGRTCSVKDMLIDFSGFISAAAIMLIIYIIINIIKKRKFNDKVL